MGRATSKGNEAKSKTKQPSDMPAPGIPIRKRLFMGVCLLYIVLIYDFFNTNIAFGFLTYFTLQRKYLLNDNRTDIPW